MTEFKPLAKRFAGPMIAAYLLHWGVWSALLTGTQVVLALMTRSVNWFAALFGQVSVVEQETVFFQLLPAELVEGIVPIIAGLLVGWWVLYRERRILRPPASPSS